MAKSCYVCGRGSSMMQFRSHSMVATKRRVYPNLQTKKIEGKRRIVCARCIKTSSKTLVA
ncbi:MAG TPA: DUF2180 family protein [Patescibacteria group bacterium]|nr:DUF2180 family protein [Patescibacteria group bacterium]